MPIAVKNRAPAPIQVSAEQLLREARDRQVDVEMPKARRQITDTEELKEYRMSKRKEFEDKIRMQRGHIGNYIKYAVFEEAQKEYERARSVFERGLDVDYQQPSVWLKYAEMEMRNKFVNHARNVWDRAVSLLPRIDQFWYKYTYMEEMLENYAGARTLFERWMAWEPDDVAWGAYVKFEERRRDLSRARGVFERYVAALPSLRSYLKYARWEERQHQLELARRVYERALSELGSWEVEGEEERLFLAFAGFEERCREFERARVIYRYAQEQLPRERAPELFARFAAFEKKHGRRGDIEDVIISGRREHYAARVAAEPYDYDAWFDLARLEEAECAADAAGGGAAAAGDARDADARDARLARARDVYERAISHVPPTPPGGAPEKRLWRRYVYLWLNYAIFEELVARDASRAREVLRACVRVVPHRHFTFAKVWVMLAELDVRQKNLPGARATYGEALGRCGHLAKAKLYREYVRLEQQLGEVDRCRSIYAKWLEAAPTNCAAWARFAELEAQCEETARARAVYEKAIEQPALDQPEALWKAYIDFEISLLDRDADDDDDDDDDDDEPGGEPVPQAERVRRLYERLLERTQHVKVWLSYAQFEASREGKDEGGGGVAQARALYRRACAHLKQVEQREECVVLLEAWRAAERALPAGVGDAAAVEAMMPRKIKKKRMLTADDGSELGWEEYYDYQFPDEQKAPANLKILEMAHKWKMAQKRKAEEISAGDAHEAPES